MKILHTKRRLKEGYKDFAEKRSLKEGYKVLLKKEAWKKEIKIKKEENKQNKRSFYLYK